MDWLRSGLHSLSHSLPFSDWLGAPPAAPAGPSTMLEDARDAMLEVLDDVGRARNAKLVLRITAASDAHSLWALRPELMTAAARLHGEAEARRRIAAATVHFETLLPAATESQRRRPAARMGASR